MNVKLELIIIMCEEKIVENNVCIPHNANKNVIYS